MVLVNVQHKTQRAPLLSLTSEVEVSGGSRDAFKDCPCLFLCLGIIDGANASLGGRFALSVVRMHGYKYKCGNLIKALCLNKKNRVDAAIVFGVVGDLGVF